MIVRVASFVHGDVYTDMLNRFALPSIHHDAERLKAEGIDVQYFRYESFKDLIEGECKAAVETGSYTFMAPPDHVWSKGSLYNLVKIAEHLPYCIAVPHFRVKDTWNHRNYPIDAKDLVRLAVEYAHETFQRSYDNLPQTECHHGITARKLDEGVLAIKHNMPSVFLAKFTEADRIYFQNAGHILGQWDRGWLGKLLTERRVKIVGSSDIAMTAEITRKQIGMNDLRPNTHNDAHHENLPHHQILRSFIYGLNF